MRYSLGIAPFRAFSLSPFALDTSRSIRTLHGVSEFFFDAIAAERPILPVPPLVFDPLCLALARQGTLELFPLCVPYLKILRSLVTPCTFSAFLECNPNLTPLHVLGCLGCCVGFLSISISFSFRIRAWTSSLRYTTQRARRTLDQVCIPSYMNPGWLLRLEYCSRLDLIILCSCLSHGYSWSQNSALVTIKGPWYYFECIIGLLLLQHMC